MVSVVFCISALSGVRAQGPINSEIRNVRSLAKDRELEEDRALHDMLNASITDVYSIKPLMQVIYGSGPQAITDGRRVVNVCKTASTIVMHHCFVVNYLSEGCA